MHKEPGKEETILIVNPDETAGTLLVVTGDEPDPITDLAPTGGDGCRPTGRRGRSAPAGVPFIVMQDLKTTRCRALFRPAADRPRRPVPNHRVGPGRRLQRRGDQQQRGESGHAIQLASGTGPLSPGKTRIGATWRSRSLHCDKTTSPRRAAPVRL